MSDFTLKDYIRIRAWPMKVTIPVDTNIRKVTNEFLGTEYEDNASDNRAVEEFWQEVCENQGLIPVQADEPLWLIGKHWDAWGQAYVEEEVDSTTR